MSSPEDILRGDPPAKKKRGRPPGSKTKSKKEASTEFSIPSYVSFENTSDVSFGSNTWSFQNVHAFPVHPKPGAQTTWHAFRGSGRVVKIPTGWSTFHHFEGLGRPVNTAFYSA